MFEERFFSSECDVNQEPARRAFALKKVNHRFSDCDIVENTIFDEQQTTYPAFPKNMCSDFREVFSEEEAVRND